MMDSLLILVCGVTFASGSIGQWKRDTALENKDFENARLDSTAHSPWKCVLRCHKESAVSLTHNDKTGACSCFDTKHDEHSPFTEQIGNVYFTVEYPQCKDQSHSGVIRAAFGIHTFCDVSSNGNWLVFQRRLDGTESFNKTYQEYADGFGDLNKEFWLGNKHLHSLTSTGRWQLRYDVTNTRSGSVYNVYDDFRIGNASSKYTLCLGNKMSGNTSGNSGNLLIHSGQNFSANDQDNDSSPSHCAASHNSGWWFKNCYVMNPNSPKRTKCGTNWYRVLDGCTIRAELKMRRVDV